MNGISHIFNTNPLLRHCNDRERDHLASQCRVSTVKRGQVIDLKKIAAFNTILEGVFELEVFGKNEFIYLTPGSYFGDFPFTEIKNRGTIRALTDGRLLNFNTDDLYKFFFTNYRAFRGYIRTLEKLGLEINPAGQALFSKRSRIITVFSHDEVSGKSMFASSLALSLADSGRTILLDMSYGGNSVFNFLGKKITPALSQKQVETAATDDIVGDKLEKVTDSLDILNVLHGAKVKASPSIISPLLLALSKNYAHIVIDLSNADEEFRDRVFEQSDYIIGIQKSTRNRETLFGLLDSRLDDGQRVYHVLNCHFKEASNFDGGYSWEKLDFGNGTDQAQMLDVMKKSVPHGIMERIVARKQALVLQTGRIDSLAYAGMLIEMMNNSIQFDVYYATSFAFLPLVLLLLAKSPDDFRERVIDAFSVDRLNSLLDVTFPRESLFKNSKLLRMASDVSHAARAEFFSIQPLLLAARRDGNTRLFSTGRLSDLITASMITYPLFEPHMIGNEAYISGYPSARCGVEELNRMDIENQVIATIKPYRSAGHAAKGMPFYENFLSYFDAMPASEGDGITTARRLEIEIQDYEDDPEKLLSIAARTTNKFLKENHLI